MKNCPVCAGELKKVKELADIHVYQCKECLLEIPFAEKYSKMIQETEDNFKK